MVDLKSKRILVIDSGSFFSLALNLTDYYKEVLYYVQWTSGFPGPEKYRIGSEFKNGEELGTFDGKSLRRVDSIWENLKNIDVVFMTDVYDGDIADHLRELGYPVVHAGSKGAELELNRWEMLKEFKKAGMDVPNVTRVMGMSALKEKLKTLKDKWIKISRFRKTAETFHHENWLLSQPILEKLEYNLGTLKETIEFLIWDPIESVTESGIDCYSVKGKYPKNTLAGNEVKDKAYYGEILSYDKLPKEIQTTTNQLSPILAKLNYRGFFSTEIRTTKEGKSYIIDMTQRCPLPPSPLYTLMYKNFGQIIWELGQGNVIDIEPTNKCGLYLTITTDNDEQNQAIYFDPKYRDNIKLSYPCKVNGEYGIININHFPEIGSVCCVGNSYEDCYNQMKQIVPTIKGYGIKVDIEDCEKAYEEFNKMMGNENPPKSKS